jgi:hypothetical protein
MLSPVSPSSSVRGELSSAGVLPCAPPDRWLRVAMGAAGVVFGTAGFLALAAIPRGIHEFIYWSFPSSASLLEPLPFAPMNGFTPEQLSSHLARLALLAPGCTLLGVALGPAASRAMRCLGDVRARPIALASALLVVAAVAFVLRSVPTQDDDATYLMHASLIAQNRVAAPPVAPEHRWHEPFTLFTRSATTGKYLFGTALVLSAGMRLEVPMLGHVLLVLATLLVFHAALVRAGGGRVSTLATAFLAFSPEFIFTSATPTSQTPALAGVALAAWGVVRSRELGGIMAGLGLGFALTCRPQMAVPCGIALALTYGWRDRRLAVSALLTGIPWVLAVLVYNSAITGSFFVMPFDVFTVERYGFGWPLGLTHEFYYPPIKSLLNLFVVLVRLNGWGLGWPVSLAGPIAWIALGRPRSELLRPWTAMAIATVVFQLGYYSVGTSETGAIYHYAVLPFIALSTAAALEALGARKRLRDAATGIAFACMVLGTGSFLVEHAARLSRLTELIDEPARVAREGTREPALVFLEGSFAGKLPIGWVNGPPFRIRSTYEPLMIYPRMSPSATANLRREWSSRNCYYEYYDYAAARYRLTGCEDIPRFATQFDREERYMTYPHPESLDGTFPRWVGGGWRTAFPWLFFLR